MDNANPSEPEQAYELFTDGSCLGNPGPGGWACVLQGIDGSLTYLTGYETSTTNNRMELTAVIKGLEYLQGRTDVTVVTDSQYVMQAFVQGWLIDWKRRGWKTSGKKDVKNRDLWERLDVLVQAHDVAWKWVKGHGSNESNNRADRMAFQAAQEVDLLLRMERAGKEKQT
jgi:ribonuclease HI